MIQQTDVLPLEWDSDFFSRKIGYLNMSHNLIHDILTNTLRKAKDQGYELIYLFSDQGAELSDEFLNQQGGSLVDRKVIYFKSLINDNEESFANVQGVKKYVSPELNADLENLAYNSGAYSRFRNDPGFDPNDFYRLYKTWIEKSIQGVIADDVIVAEQKGTITGMLTMKYLSDTGRIGLIAVSEVFRGQGIGQRIMNFAMLELLKRGINNLEVATQKENLHACRFYEKCGFSVKSITNVYHFWL